jgi:hypothetical protein
MTLIGSLSSLEEIGEELSISLNPSLRNLKDLKAALDAA